MRVQGCRLPSFLTDAFCLLGTGLLLLVLPACNRTPVVITKSPPVPATPSPHEQALIERAVRDRLAEEDRATEQQLANARAAASQRMVGRQMFLKLEEQYRQRQTEIAEDRKSGQEKSPESPEQGQAQPSATP